MNDKKWYTSRTLWVNALAIVWFITQHFTGWVIPPEYQALALAGVNKLLRLITKSPVVWS